VIKVGNILIHKSAVVPSADIVRSSLTLGKAVVTVTSHFEGSVKLFDLLLSNARTGIEGNKVAAKPVYLPTRNPCYNESGS